MTENHEEPRNKRHPGAIVCTTGSHLGFAHFLRNKRSKETFQKVHEDNWQRRLPAKHAERIRKARILGAVVTNIVIFTFREFCDPYGAGNRPQQVRYWKAQ